MGGFKHTNVGSSTANGEYVEHSQLATLSSDMLIIIAAINASIAAIETVGTAKVFFGNVAPDKFIFIPNSPATLVRADYPDLFDLLVTDSGYVATNFTVTIASPGVVTSAGHGFTGGEIVRLTTTGALPTGLNTTTDYFVKYINANTFNLSLTDGGASIITTGSQSPTHSYLRSDWGLGDGSTTFNIPWIDVGELPVQAAYEKNAGKHTDGIVKTHTHNVSSTIYSVFQTVGGGSEHATIWQGTGTQTNTSTGVSGASAQNLSAGTYAKWILKVLA
jgi:hypothetical protein